MRYALLSLSLLFTLLAPGCAGDDDKPPATSPPAATTATATPIGGSMILATTTSTQDSGLLDELVPRFKALTGVEVKVIAVGSGAALEMGARGDADAVLVHSPAAEQRYVDSSDLVEGKLVMHNDFILLGPPGDPAGVKGARSLTDAMKAIALATFTSRGDDSGTHRKELDLWKAAGIDPKTAKREETGQGMGATLNVASQKRAYTLSDRATYLAQRERLELEVVFEGDLNLLNVYHVYLVNPSKHSAVKAAHARAWVEFMVAADTQRAIAEFGRAKYGQSLFVPDAGKDPATLGLAR